MSITHELRELEAMLQSGTLTLEEFEIAKGRILTGALTTPTAGDLEDFKIQNEIAQLDREWTLERENYMIVGRYGAKHLPERTSGHVFGTIFVIGFAVAWIAIAINVTRSDAMASIIFPLFGVGFIVLCVLSGVENRRKAAQYESAQRRYRDRRNSLIEHREGASGDTTRCNESQFPLPPASTPGDS